ncbi:cyclic nucleotide-binding protein [Vibrio nigripulchritudo ATCC 27043]|nr:cyclic nucleotide-binding protein [Vibrio nigripulchritudo ATCC 27043]
MTKFDFQTLHQQTQNDIELSQNVIEILLKFAMKKEQRERDLLCLSAQERYEKLLESSPNLIERVTQNDIARYLGVTPVGLSRIKQRVLGH